MSIKNDSRTFARALYETLVGTALEQLHAAAPKLKGVGSSDADVQKKIDAALPSKSLPEVRNFLLLLSREGALEQLGTVIEAFESYSSPDGRALDAEITSAIELNQAQRDRISADLRGRHGEDLEITFTVDESLIGGLIIRVGDQVIDNSLRTRLDGVQRSMQLS
jgi:F-type H+-transporting ATPase subunit delta